MPAVPVPVWLRPAEVAWLPCSVKGTVGQGTLAIDVQLNGSTVAAIVPEGVVQNDRVRVLILADLAPDDPFGRGRLIELPGEPISATQRQKVRAEWLAES